MVDVNELRDWIAYAEEDLGTAKLLLKAKNRFSRRCVSTLSNALKNI